MKRLLPAFLVGFVVGAAALWLRQPHPEGATEEKVPESAEKQEAGIHLSVEQETSAGLRVAQPEGAEMPPEVMAFARVLDAGPLATLLAEREAAQAGATATTREFARLKSLGENAAPRALETAEAAMKRDQAAVESVQVRLLATWGRALVVRADLATLVHALLAQEAALVRVDLLAGDEVRGVPRSIRIAPSTGDVSSREAEWIGPAPAIDPQAQGQAFLALLRDRVPPSGSLLAAWVSTEGEARKGFRLPRTAVVQQGSGHFVFLSTAKGTFERRRVQVDGARSDGVFVTGGIAADDRVVMVGAQQLLSEESKRSGGGD